MAIPAALRTLAIAASFCLAILFPSTASAEVVPNPSTWTIDQNTLTAVDAQEESWLSDGDEPYIAVIRFRSRFGQAGSTQATFLGGLKELHSGADDGDSMTIPDSMGRSDFADVTRLDGLALFNGQNPEIVGTITVAMESDATPFSFMATGFRRAAEVARKEIASIVETTTVAQIIADPAAFQAKVTDVATRVRKRAQLSVWEDIGLTLVSLGDPDDRIGAKVSLFIGIDEKMFTNELLAFLKGLATPEGDLWLDQLQALPQTIDSQLAAAVPPSQGVAGTLRRRNYSLDFAGDGATYRVSHKVFPN